MAQMRMRAAKRQILADLDQLHHAAVFVAEDKTKKHKQASEVDEAAAHLEVTAGDYVSLRVRLRLRNGEGVPPDERRLELRRRRHRVRVVDLDDLERVDVNVEGMGGLRRRVV